MNYYKEIKTKILDNEAYERIKDYSKERHRVLTYFEIGRLLHEAGKHYGESIINKYAQSLKKDFGKKYDERTLRRMRQFYLFFNELKWSTLENISSKSLCYKDNFEQKWATLASSKQKVATPEKDVSFNLLLRFNLSWSHYKEVLSISDTNEALYYINITASNHLSVRELRKKIKSKEYNRLDEKTRNKLINLEETTAIDYVKNPILIKNNNNYSDITEKILQALILEDLSAFLKELGDGFSFIDNEYKIKIDDRYNYIDLLLYNIKYKCYVVIELKVTEFKSEYIGQILKYMHYIDKNLKTINEDKTIGIIICKKNNHFYMEYCSDERVISREYKLINKA